MLAIIPFHTHQWPPLHILFPRDWKSSEQTVYKPRPAPIGAIPPMDYIIPPTPKAPESTYSANDDGATLELNTAAAPG